MRHDMIPDVKVEDTMQNCLLTPSQCFETKTYFSMRSFENKCLGCKSIVVQPYGVKK